MDHKIFGENKIGNDFVIGDIHGCFDLFMDMLEEIDFDHTKDRMFSVGDLIDRGPNSLECLKLIKEPWFHAVRGNHEDLMINSILGFNSNYLWIQNGGIWHLDVDETELKELANLANELPYAITINDAVGICHAETPTADWYAVDYLDKYKKEKMIWGRNKVYQDLETIGIKTTYHGHTIMKDVTFKGNAVFLDTGAFATGILSVIKL